MLENPRAARVRAVANLARRKGRTDTGHFLLEGPQALAEALRFRPDLLVELYATPTALERHVELAESIETAGMPFEFVSEDVLAAMADTVTPQGFVSVCRQFPTAVKDLFTRRLTLIAVLQEVRDPGNAGTIIRAADAAGADAVILTGRTVDPYNPKVVRATTGSLFHLPIAVGADLEDVARRVAGAGMQLFAADVKGEDLLAARAGGALAAGTAWLFGNEARGLDDEQLSLADRVLAVPIYGSAESMNLATAASVCLYESAFAQHS